MKLNFEHVRDQFPIFKQKVRGHRLAYLDSAATTQKPEVVIKSLIDYYTSTNANVHRGVHYLSERATLEFEAARATVQKFINARDAKECIFVKSATEAVNLVATSFGNAFVNEGDEIVVSLMEHHSNFVPWQMLCKQKKAHLKFIPINSSGELEIEKLPLLLNKKTKLIAVSHASNAIGTLHPIEQIIKIAHEHNIPVLIDGAQTIPHIPINVQSLDCDFFVFSGHKAYGPTGIGVLYGKEKWLEKMPPYQGGGEMIEKVSQFEVSFNELPFKFEAGTPAIAEAIGLAKALDFITGLGFDNICHHEHQLMKVAEDALTNLPGIHIVGNPRHRMSIISFIMEGIHPHDIGTLADQRGVALRTGHHCAMPLMEFLQIPGTSRISFGLYNTNEDIHQLIEALYYIQKTFKGNKHELSRV